MGKLNCLQCGKEIDVIPPCFIQLCDDCKENINWGNENGKNKNISG